MKILLLLFLALLTSACAYNPMPKDYTGPTSTITEMGDASQHQVANLFYISKVDGKRINNSATATFSRNRGRGQYMDVIVVKHTLPSKPVTLTLTGETIFAAPILGLTNTKFLFTGNIDFTPEEGKQYIINGALSKEYSAIWIEEAATKTIVSNKLETRESTEVSFARKLLF